MDVKFSSFVIFIALLTGSFITGNKESKCSEKIFLSNETRTLAIPRKTDDACLEVSPPGGDAFLGAIINTAALSFHVDGDQEMPPPSMDKQHCLILTFSKHCEVWQEPHKDICPGSLTVLTIHGPTTLRLHDNSNSTASISYLPVGKLDGFLYDCYDVEPPTTITTEEITEPTEPTPEQQTTQSSVTTQTATTSVLMKTIHLTSESNTSHSLVTNSSNLGNDQEDGHGTVVIVLSVLLGVFLVVVIAIGIDYCRKHGKTGNGKKNGRNPEHATNEEVSGDDLLNGNQSVTSNPPGESQEMQPVVRN